MTRTWLMDGFEHREVERDVEAAIRVGVIDAVPVADVCDYLFAIEASPHVEIHPTPSFRPEFNVKHGYYRRSGKRRRPPKS